MTRTLQLGYVRGVLGAEKLRQTSRNVDVRSDGVGLDDMIKHQI